MTLTAGVALLVFVAVVIALAARLLRRPARDAVPAVARVTNLSEAEPAEPAPLEPTLPEPETAPVITWTFALTTAVLDEAGRLRLIDDLALLAAPWTIALLRRAYQEERSPQLRVRIEAALASSGEPIGT